MNKYIPEAGDASEFVVVNSGRIIPPPCLSSLS
jgi:hypothetical protein